MLSRFSLIAAACAFLSACGSDRKGNAARMSGGAPDRGAASISRYGCGSRRTIPGINGPHGLVGPPLAGVGSRVYVAGMLPNTPVNLAHWIEDPHSVNRGTAMPNLGFSKTDAADIAAHLYSLK
jgi:cytochrome c